SFQNWSTRVPAAVRCRTLGEVRGRTTGAKASCRLQCITVMNRPDFDLGPGVTHRAGDVAYTAAGGRRTGLRTLVLDGYRNGLALRLLTRRADHHRPKAVFTVRDDRTLPTQ